MSTSLVGVSYSLSTGPAYTEPTNFNLIFVVADGVYGRYILSTCKSLQRFQRIRLNSRESNLLPTRSENSGPAYTEPTNFDLIFVVADGVYG
eukprot:Awhi_evm1s14525